MRKIILLVPILFGLSAISQQTTQVKVPPSKDTTIITFKTNTTTSSNTTTTYTLDTKPGGGIDTTPPPASGYPGFKRVYANDFEKGTVLSDNQCGRCRINTEKPITGTGTFESNVVAGDDQISGGWRSEQQYDGSLTPTDKKLIIEYDQRFDILPASVQGLAFQIHGTQQGTSGNYGVWISGGQYVIQLQKTGISGSKNTYSPALETIEIGKVYHMKHELRLSNKSTGYIKVTINGVVKYDITGANCDGRGQYPKPGINLFNDKNTVKAQIDNLRFYVEE